MVEGREGDLRFPIISCLIFLSVLIGGGFLIVYVFVPKLSQPWHPIAALVLIGFPWIFWFLTYIYTCFKSCSGGGGGGAGSRDRYASRRGNLMATSGKTANCASPEESSEASTGGNRQVQLGAVVVMDGGGSPTQGGGKADSPFAPTIESQRLSTPSVSS